MNQLTFKFPFKTSYFENDFYVSESNFSTYRLIESWPNWPSKSINIFGPKGCGKTHLANIFNKKIKSFLIQAKEIENIDINVFKSKDCLIIDNYENNINEINLYSIINQANQLNQHIIINSLKPLKKMSVNLKDLRSRLDSFTELGIDLPTDDLISVIITKYFSDKQIKVNVKILEYILKNIDRSYEKIFKFVEEVDNVSLSTGKSINIHLIKNILKNE